MRIAAIQASPSPLPTITMSGFVYKPKCFRRPLVAKLPFLLRFPSFRKKLEVPATKRQPFQLEESQKSTESEIASLSEKGDGGSGYGWLAAFPHVLLASMANVIFGYHIGLMNGPTIFIARELGFEGNSLLEGLVVSIFIAGAFIGSVSSGLLVDNLGCRRTIQIDTFTLILGPILSAQAHSWDEMLWGRFLVGLGIGVNTAFVPIYISEVSPTRCRGSPCVKLAPA